jgi:hypothetical protein
MNRFCHVIAATLVLALPAWAKLEIVNIKVMHGPLGPEHKDQTKIEVYPGEELFFKYSASGAGTDEGGNVSGSFEVKVLDGNGNVQINEKSAFKGVIALGGGTFPGITPVSFGPAAPAGKYKVVVTVTDALREETASFEREVTVKPRAFAAINPRFFHDSDHKVAAPVGGHVNQVLFFRLFVIGFDVAQMKIKTKMAIQVLDKNGRDMMPQPITASVVNNKAEEVAKITSLTFNGSLALNRAGEFTLRFTFTDEMGNKQFKFEAPLKVLD